MQDGGGGRQQQIAVFHDRRIIPARGVVPPTNEHIVRERVPKLQFFQWDLWLWIFAGIEYKPFCLHHEERARSGREERTEQQITIYMLICSGKGTCKVLCAFDSVVL
jgi:hypothetical protein